jgi:hypothetical protein
MLYRLNSPLTRKTSEIWRFLESSAPGHGKRPVKFPGKERKFFQESPEVFPARVLISDILDFRPRTEIIDYHFLQCI